MASGTVSPKSPCVTRLLGLTEAALFELCDIVRAGLISGDTPETATESITDFLEAATIDELRGIPTIGLSTIRKTRLDDATKAVEDIHVFVQDLHRPSALSRPARRN